MWPWKVKQLSVWYEMSNFMNIFCCKSFANTQILIYNVHRYNYMYINSSILPFVWQNTNLLEIARPVSKITLSSLKSFKTLLKFSKC